ncbi:MAG: tRNA (guanosine(46)-N7)-methyltransferase TrmB [Pirellulales bacterium]
MSRPKIRKIDPSLDLAQYLKVFEELPRPWDAAVWFGRTAPLEIEVGSGKGLFLAKAAGGQPETDFLGIEVAHNYARFVAARLAKQNLTNARIIDGDALRIFREVLPEGVATAVHVYFPDPWWKARHKKRRVMTEAFVRDIQRVLRAGGTLHFWTDVEEYFTTSLAILASQTTLVGPLEVGESPASHDLDYRTHFERRTRLAGEAVYRAKFSKPADSAI